MVSAVNELSTKKWSYLSVPNVSTNDGRVDKAHNTEEESDNAEMVNTENGNCPIE